MHDIILLEKKLLNIIPFIDQLKKKGFFYNAVKTGRDVFGLDNPNPNKLSAKPYIDDIVIHDRKGNATKLFFYLFYDIRGSIGRLMPSDEYAEKNVYINWYKILELYKEKFKDSLQDIIYYIVSHEITHAMDPSSYMPQERKYNIGNLRKKEPKGFNTYALTPTEVTARSSDIIKTLKQLADDNILSSNDILHAAASYPNQKFIEWLKPNLRLESLLRILDVWNTNQPAIIINLRKLIYHYFS